MEITNDALNAVHKYFHTLSNLGYKKYKDVTNLIVFLFLEELLCGTISQFITEEDYNTIDKALYCLYGTSCMLPYPDYKKTHIDSIEQMLHEYRISEDGVLRMTEMDSLRTIV